MLSLGLRVNSGYVGDDFWTSRSRLWASESQFRASGSCFWPEEGLYRHSFSNLRLLGVDFWCLGTKLGTLGVIIRPLSVNFRSRIIRFSRHGGRFCTRNVDLGPFVI